MKVKEDDSGEKIAHKKKKNKHTSLPENQNSTTDDMTLPEMKKGKKSKNIDAVVTEVESIVRDVVIKEKKKKKKSKSDAESLDDAASADVKNGDDASSKKKKKKKKLADDENLVDTAENEEEAGTEKKLKQDKKVKKKSLQKKPENLETGEVEEQKTGKDYLQEATKESKNNVSAEVTEIEEKVKEKKKKKKVNSEENVKSEDETSVKKKKKKAKTEVSENGVEIEKLEGENSAVQEVKLKKKKKKKLVENEAELSQLEMDDCSILKSRDESTEGEIVVTEDEGRKQKKKGKKEKNGQISLEVSEVEETEPKKKKKKRKKGEKREHTEVKCEEVEEQSTETSKKKKKSSGQDVNSETSTKKKKVKKEETDEHELAQADVVSLSKKSGNTHEVNSKQERKPDSQMEVEQMPEPQKPAKPTGFGQWSSAQFNSSEQQQKFLRLMGGFKKSFQPSSESTGGGNMALGKDAQQQLQQGLLGEFERAQSRRMDFSNRGAGLGFTAPSNKKFSIDINASRSVRFDD